MTKTSGLLWSGEHWIAYLRRPGDASNSASVGVYHARYSPAGEGNVALIDIPGENALRAAVTDNRAVYEFTMERIRAGASDDPFNDLGLPVLDGSLIRGGDVRFAPYWVVNAGGHSLVVGWTRLVEPFIMSGRPPNDKGTVVAFSVLIFANRGTIILDGTPAPGSPYFREVWRRITGPDGPASSFCFALAETYTTRSGSTVSASPRE